MHMKQKGNIQPIQFSLRSAGKGAYAIIPLTQWQHPTDTDIVLFSVHRQAFNCAIFHMTQLQHLIQLQALRSVFSAEKGALILSFTSHIGNTRLITYFSR